MQGDVDERCIAVLGAGSWGTALAIALARNHRAVCLWGRDPRRLATLARERCNARYLPECSFPEPLTVEPDLVAVARTGDPVLVVVPSHAFGATLDVFGAALDAAGRPRDAVRLVWGTKGFEPGAGRLLSELAAERLGSKARLAVVSGPSFAAEVARGLPTALTVAANDERWAGAVAGWFRGSATRVYTNPDLRGVQLGGAIKNVMAIATGIGDGLALGANARAAVITRGLAELSRLGAALGGQPDTFMGLAGVGDLILTCTDDQSRNRRLGLALGRGTSLAAALAEVGQEAEGVNAARELLRIGRRRDLRMPITEQVCQVLDGAVRPEDAVQALLRREPRAE